MEAEQCRRPCQSAPSETVAVCVKLLLRRCAVAQDWGEAVGIYSEGRLSVRGTMLSQSDDAQYDDPYSYPRMGDVPLVLLTKIHFMILDSS